MAAATVIKNVRIVNEGKISEGDLRISGQRIERIEREITPQANDTVIEGGGRYLLPGMIDDQVHFREPGLTHKGNIASESRAAVAGGITSFMEMPNVSPVTTTIEALEAKYAIAANSAYGNYGFYLGATEDNLEQIKRLDPTKHCGVKVFMGASTGDLLVEAPQALDDIFRESPVLIVTHCESGPVISRNRTELLKQKSIFTIDDHPRLRDAEACYASSSYAVDLAKRHGSQLHVLHITTEKELSLFSAGPIAGKHITAEACVHHLWFSNQDYTDRGNLIKCNPAVKYPSDRDTLIKALHSGQIDIIATDHAPHTWDEKQVDYDKAPAGLPLVQHALLSLLEHVKQGRMSLPQVVEKVSHNPALRFAVAERGFLREGFFADLVLVDCESSTHVTHENSLYHCGWSPFDGVTFGARIESTWVNGQQVFDGQTVGARPEVMRLRFDR
ncbi:dihydroorotase [Aliagarivorans taiwanensis]|uniref:dihydroorotase n=1 Tax=Aliagarivorans taiwanensis TaxID=561966 RepID=UPI000405489D|nr:dihydroorotase [Aliagarivorans taiwanensis]